MLVAHKAGDPKGRPCIDLRRVNDITIADKYPLPSAQYLRDRIARAKVFTKLDQRNSFNLIRIKAGHEWKYAFLVPSGLYEPMVMPFGAKNTLATC